MLKIEQREGYSKISRKKLEGKDKKQKKQKPHTNMPKIKQGEGF